MHSLIYARIEQAFGADAAGAYAAANPAALAMVVDLVGALAIDCELEGADAFTYTESPDRTSRPRWRRPSGPAFPHPSRPRPTFPIRWRAPSGWATRRTSTRRYCLGLAEAIVAERGSIFERTRALDVDDESGIVTGGRWGPRRWCWPPTARFPRPAASPGLSRCAPTP